MANATVIGGVSYDIGQAEEVDKESEEGKKLLSAFGQAGGRLPQGMASDTADIYTQPDKTVGPLERIRLKSEAETGVETTIPGALGRLVGDMFFMGDTRKISQRNALGDILNGKWQTLVTKPQNEMQRAFSAASTAGVAQIAPSEYADVDFNTASPEQIGKLFVTAGLDPAEVRAGAAKRMEYYASRGEEMDPKTVLSDVARTMAYRDVSNRVHVSSRASAALPSEGGNKPGFGYSVIGGGLANVAYTGQYAIGSLAGPTGIVLPLLASYDRRFEENRRAGYSLTPEGELYKSKEGLTAAEAVLPSAVGAAGETAIEVVGGELVGKGAGWLAKKALPAAVTRFGSKVVKDSPLVRGFVKSWGDISKITKAQSYPLEIVEEYEEALFDAAFQTTPEYRKQGGLRDRMVAATAKFGKDFPETVLSMLLTQGLQAGAAAVTGGTEASAERRKERTAADVLEAAGATDEQVKTWLADRDAASVLEYVAARTPERASAAASRMSTRSARAAAELKKSVEWMDAATDGGAVSRFKAPTPDDFRPERDNTSRYTDEATGVSVVRDSRTGEVEVSDANTGRVAYATGGTEADRMERAFAIADTFDREAQGRDIVNAKKRAMVERVLKAKGVGGEYVVVDSVADMAGMLSESAKAALGDKLALGQMPQGFVDAGDGDGAAPRAFIILDSIPLGRGEGAVARTVGNILEVATHEPVHMAAKSPKAAAIFKSMYDNADPALRLEVIRHGAERELGLSGAEAEIAANAVSADDTPTSDRRKERKLRNWFEEGVAYLSEGPVGPQATGVAKLRRRVKDAFGMGVRDLSDIGVLAERAQKAAKGPVRVSPGASRVIAGQDAEAREEAPVAVPETLAPAAAKAAPVSEPAKAVTPAAPSAEEADMAAFVAPEAEPPPVEEAAAVAPAPEAPPVQKAAESVQEAPAQVRKAPEIVQPAPAKAKSAGFDVENFGAVPLPLTVKYKKLTERLQGLRERVLKGGVAERENFPEYKALSREERDELIRYGWTFDVDRMGKPTIGLSDASRTEYRRWQMAEKRKAASAAPQPPPVEEGVAVAEAPAQAEEPLPAPPAKARKGAVAPVSEAQKPEKGPVGKIAVSWDTLDARQKAIVREAVETELMLLEREKAFRGGYGKPSARTKEIIRNGVVLRLYGADRRLLSPEQREYADNGIPKRFNKETRPQAVKRIKAAFAAQSPVPAADIDKYGLKVPDTYALKDGAYVFTPVEQKAVDKEVKVPTKPTKKGIRADEEMRTRKTVYGEMVSGPLVSVETLKPGDYFVTEDEPKGYYGQDVVKFLRSEDDGRVVGERSGGGWLAYEKSRKVYKLESLPVPEEFSDIDKRQKDYDSFFDLIDFRGVNPFAKNRPDVIPAFKDVPPGSKVVSVGKGQYGNEAPLYAIVPTGEVYKWESGFQHGGLTPWRFKGWSKWHKGERPGVETETTVYPKTEKLSEQPTPKPAKKLTRPQRVAAVKKAFAAKESVPASEIDALSGLKVPDTYALKDGAYVYTPTEAKQQGKPTKEEKDAKGIRSDEGQVRAGGQEGQPQVQRGAKQGGRDLERVPGGQEAPGRAQEQVAPEAPPAAAPQKAAEGAKAPELMTPEELRVYEQTKRVADAEKALNDAKKGVESPNVFVNGFKTKAALVRAREAALEEAKKSRAPEIWTTVVDAANAKRPISAALVDGEDGRSSGGVPSNRDQLIENITGKGYVREGDLYVWKPEGPQGPGGGRVEKPAVTEREAAPPVEKAPESVREAPSETGETRFRVTQAQDAEYMAAVEAGDMEKAQRMVDGNVIHTGDAFGKRISERGRGDIAFRVGRDEPVFFSQLRRTLEAKMPNRMTVMALRGMIDPSKGSGIKADEIEWSGLKEFMDSKNPGDYVTKAEVLEATKDVEIQEVVKNGPGFEGRSVRQQELINRENAGTITDEERDELDVIDEQVRRGEQGEDETKFSQYQLPGGENYRELLLTLPNRKRYYLVEENGFWWVFDNNKGRTVGTGFDYESQAKQHLADYYQDVPVGEQYRSPHFSEPNILAHVRFNERQTAEGDKTLFLEEVQSDWHQAGREKGYASTEIGVKDDMAKRYFGKGYAELSTEDKSVVDETYKKPEMRGKRAEGVPDAPFKDTSKGWARLAFKRMLRWAAEKGFDRVAWTTGEQQAGRYDLSKPVDELILIPSGSSYRITGRKDGRELPLGTHEKEDLAEVIGKEAAKKVAEWDGNPDYIVLSGLDLKVGGEGMRTFYDQILPSIANDIGKKFGARVEDVGINTTTRSTMPQTYVGPKLSYKEVEDKYLSRDINATVRSQLRDILDEMNEGVPFQNAADKTSPLTARVLGGDIEYGKLPDIAVHSLPVTESMRDSVMGGQPMFRIYRVRQDADAASLEAAAASLAALDNVVRDDPALYRRPKNAPQTAIEEPVMFDKAGLARAAEVGGTAPVVTPARVSDEATIREAEATYREAEARAAIRRVNSEKAPTVSDRTLAQMRMFALKRFNDGKGLYQELRAAQKAGDDSRAAVLEEAAYALRLDLDDATQAIGTVGSVRGEQLHFLQTGFDKNLSVIYRVRKVREAQGVPLTAAQYAEIEASVAEDEKAARALAEEAERVRLEERAKSAERELADVRAKMDAALRDEFRKGADAERALFDRLLARKGAVKARTVAAASLGDRDAASVPFRVTEDAKASEWPAPLREAARRIFGQTQGDGLGWHAFAERVFEWSDANGVSESLTDDYLGALADRMGLQKLAAPAAKYAAPSIDETPEQAKAKAAVRMRRSVTGAVRQAVAEDPAADGDKVAARAVEILKEGGREGTNPEWGWLTPEDVMRAVTGYPAEIPPDTRDGLEKRYDMIRRHMLAIQRIEGLRRGEYPSPMTRGDDAPDVTLRQLTRELRDMMNAHVFPEGEADPRMVNAAKALENRLTYAIEELRKAVETGAPINEKAPRPVEETDAIRDLRAVLKGLRAAYEALPAVQEIADARDAERARRAANKRYHFWAKRLEDARNGVFPESSKASTAAERDAETASYAAKAEEARREYWRIKKDSPQERLAAVTKKVSAAEERLADLEAMLAETPAPDLRKPKAPEPAPATPEEAAARERLASLRAAADNVRKAIEAKWRDENAEALEAQREADRYQFLVAKAAAIEDRIKRGDYSKAPSKPRVWSARVAMVEDKVRAGMRAIAERVQWEANKASGTLGYARNYVKWSGEVYKFFKTMMDFSNLGVQSARLFAAHPVYGLRLAAGVARAAVTEEASAFFAEAMHADADYAGAYEARLALDQQYDDVFGTGMGEGFFRRLEARGLASSSFLPRVGGRIAQVGLMSQRAFDMYGRMMRFHVYKTIVNDPAHANLTKAERRAVANMVNIMGGVGNTRVYPHEIAAVLSKLMWSSRLFTSQWQTIAGGGGLLFNAGMGAEGSRRALGREWYQTAAPGALKLYGRSLAGAFAVSWLFGGIGMLLGDRQPWEDEETGFWKAWNFLFGRRMIGSNSIDTSGGLTAYTAILRRVVDRSHVSMSGKTVPDGDWKAWAFTIANFQRGRLRPDLSLALNLVFGSDVTGAKFGPLGGAEGMWNMASEASLPITVKQMIETVGDMWNTHGVVGVTAGLIPALASDLVGYSKSTVPRDPRYEINRHKSHMGQVRKALEEAKATGDIDAYGRVAAKYAFDIEVSDSVSRLDSAARKAEEYAETKGLAAAEREKALQGAKEALATARDILASGNR